MSMAARESADLHSVLVNLTYNMPLNKKALTRLALLDRLLSNHRKAYSIQDMTEYLENVLPSYGFEPVTRRCVEKDLVYLEKKLAF